MKKTVYQHTFLQEYSPHLLGVLKRVTSDRVSQEVEAAFQFAMLHGGKLEQDFERRDSSSHNPRPARAALILIRDGRSVEPEMISAAILGSVVTSMAILPAMAREFSDRVVALSVNAALFSGMLAGASAGCFGLKDSDRENVSLIGHCLLLDRLRHLHQSEMLTYRQKQELLEHARSVVQGGTNARVRELIVACVTRQDKALSARYEVEAREVELNDYCEPVKL